MSESPRKPFGHAKSSPSSPKPSPRPVPKAPPKPAFEVVEDEPDDAGFEVVDEVPQPPKKAVKAEAAPKKALPADSEQKKAKRVEPVPVVDDDDETALRKKKKKKKLDALSKQLLKKQDEDDARRAESLKHFEFTVPTVMLVIGLAMSIVGAFGAAKGVSGIYVFTVLCVFVATYVPLSIGALMVVGLLMGINYGRLGPGILKMAAITFLVNGIWLIGEWLRLPIFVIAPISGFISYGIFMTMFDLDTSETGTSTGVLNIMTFIANVILIGFLVVAEASTNGSSKSDPEDEDPPVERKERKRDRDKKPLNPDLPPGPIMPDDDDD